MKTVTVREAQANFSELLQAVEAGEECEGFAAGGEVGGVVPPKSLDAGCAVVTALVTVIHILPFR